MRRALPTKPIARVATRRLPALLLLPAALLLAACGPDEAPRAPKDPLADARPEPLAGTASEFGLAIKPVLLHHERGSVDARFEVRNGGKGIVSIRSTTSASKPEAVVIVELFRNGKWERAPADASGAATFEELWPDATLYARTTLPRDAKWARVVVVARGASRTKDGAAAAGDAELSSDAFEVPSMER